MAQHERVLEIMPEKWETVSPEEAQTLIPRVFSEYRKILQQEDSGAISLRNYGYQSLGFGAVKMDLERISRGEKPAMFAALGRTWTSSEPHAVYYHVRNGGYTNVRVLPQNESESIERYRRYLIKAVGTDITHESFVYGAMGLTRNSASARPGWLNLEEHIQKAEITDPDIIAAIFIYKMLGQPYSRIHGAAELLVNPHTPVFCKPGTEQEFWHRKLIGRTNEVGYEGVIFSAGYIDGILPLLGDLMERKFPDNAQLAEDLLGTILYTNKKALKYPNDFTPARIGVFKALVNNELEQGYDILRQLIIRNPGAFSQRIKSMFSVTPEDLAEYHDKKAEQAVEKQIQAAERLDKKFATARMLLNVDPDTRQLIEGYIGHTLVISDRISIPGAGTAYTFRTYYFAQLNHYDRQLFVPPGVYKSYSIPMVLTRVFEFNPVTKKGKLVTNTHLYSIPNILSKLKVDGEEKHIYDLGELDLSTSNFADLSAYQF